MRNKEMEERVFSKFESCLQCRTEENQHVLDLIYIFSNTIVKHSGDYTFDEIQKALYTIWSTMSDVVRD